MKEERTNITNEEIKRYIDEARVLRSLEVMRCAGQFFGTPIRLLNRFAAFKIASAREAIESR